MTRPMGLLLAAMAVAHLGCSSKNAHPQGTEFLGKDDPTGGSGGAGGSGGTGGTGGTGTGGTGGAGGTITPKDPHAGDHLLFYDTSHGFQGAVLSVSSDRGGNVYAASRTYLNILKNGSDTWRHVSSVDGLLAYPVMSVAGGEADEVWIGYEGLFPDDNYFDDPPDIAKSGDADKLDFRADGTFSRLHYDIYSPPSKDYPQGRELLRTVYRIIPVLDGPWAGDVWFGCNHGVAEWNHGWNQLAEHVHTAIWRDGYLWTGDFRGLALTKDGNVWIAGAHRGGLIHYADEAGQFWATIDPEIDIWPDGISKDPRGDDWTNVLVVEDRGVLWAGSEGNGLARRDTDGTWSYWDTGNGLPDNRVYDMVFDPDGSLWIATDASVIRMKDGAFIHGLDWSDGLAGSPYTLHIDTTSSPRKLIVGTSNGVGIYDGP